MLRVRVECLSPHNRVDGWWSHGPNHEGRDQILDRRPFLSQGSRLKTKELRSRENWETKKQY